jgi:hypothetical protein
VAWGKKLIVPPIRPELRRVLPKQAQLIRFSGLSSLSGDPDCAPKWPFAQPITAVEAGTRDRDNLPAREK